MKEVNININTPGVAQNVQLISKIGSNLGTQFCKVEVRMAWRGGEKGFEKDKLAIESGEKSGFILNQSPKRFLAKNFMIVGTILTKDEITNDLVIVINPKADGTCDLRLPVNENTLRIMGKTTSDAIVEAIKGEKDHFFLDIKTLVAVLNEYNKRQITMLEEHIANCQSMITTLKGDINDNEQKAKQSSDAWINSSLPQNLNMPGGPNVQITVTNKEE